MPLMAVTNLLSMHVQYFIKRDTSTVISGQSLELVARR